MKIISLINSKGGVGKTTLAINLAAYLYHHTPVHTAPRILVVDADKQGSVRDWQEAFTGSENRYRFDVVAADRKATLASIKDVIEASNYAYTIIDTPGNISDITTTAISISDVCLIPICPSPYDVWATFDIVELIKTRQQVTDGLPVAAYVINRAIPNTRISKEVADYLETCALPIIGEPITQRVDYASSAKEGMTIYDTPNRAAKAEINALGEGVLIRLGVAV